MLCVAGPWIQLYIWYHDHHSSDDVDDDDDDEYDDDDVNLHEVGDEAEVFTDGLILGLQSNWGHLAQEVLTNNG